MNRSQIIFFFSVLVIVIAIARYNSRTTSSTQTAAPSPSVSALLPSIAASPSPAPSVATKPSPAAPTQVTQTQSAELRKVADHAGSTMILISIFNSSGKLLRNATGFFVSEDGRFITNRSAVEGGVHAVAKTSGGKIYNVTGILADAATFDLAILKALPKERIAFLSLSKAAEPEQGRRIAVIGNPLTRKDILLAEGTIAAKKSDPSGETLEVSMPISNEAVGSPVINESGNVVGVVTQNRQGSGGIIVRASSAVNSLLAQLGPATKARWQLAGANEPTPAEEGPSPPKPKVPLAGARPGASRLIYSPAPGYPTAARHSYFPLKGSGRFRITFALNGEVKNVAVIQSTRSDTLDQAAVETLRKWKAQPGQEWTANVPITFQP